MSRTRRIAEDLRTQIRTGGLAPGAQLPTERALMDAYGVSRGTVRLATAKLVNEGLIRVLPGRTGGMFVREQVMLTYHASRAELPDVAYSESDTYVGEVRAQGYEPSQEFVVRIEVLPPEFAQRLGVADGTSAAVRCCLRSVNGRPTSTQDTYYPQWLTSEVPELLSPQDIQQGTTRLLAERGHLQVAYIDEYEAHMPTPQQALALDLPAGTPVLHHIRTGYTKSRPVRVTVEVYAGDRNRIVNTIGDHQVLAAVAAAQDVDDEDGAQ